MSAIRCRRALSCAVELLRHRVERARGVPDPRRSEPGLADAYVVVAVRDAVRGRDDVGDRAGDASNDDRDGAGDRGAGEEQGDTAAEGKRAAEAAAAGA